MSHSQLSRLLPLPDSELQQVLEYASTLSKDEAAEHFTNLLGDSPQVIEFISSFNSRRADPKSKASAQAQGTGSGYASASSRTPQGSDIEGVPKSQRGKKKKAPLHTPAPRPVASLGPTPGMAYSKKNQEDDYMPARSGTSTPSHPQDGPTKAPPPKSATPPPSKAPPSAAGSLISDLLAPKSKSRPSSRPSSNPTSRSSTPGPGPKPAATKISITGGTPMHGASTAVTDLDEAIRSLELTTNPKHASNSPAGIAARRCNCVATRHPLQTAAPNCLNCGKVICVKEGLGPCTFCGTPLLSSSEVQGMIKELKAERGREKMAADRDAHRRPDVAAAPRPFTAPRTGLEEVNAAEAKAREHRDKLLAFQAQNARRTTVRDEAADFDVVSGGSMWASPEERARELKRQQKLLREMEWNARPEYEKRRQVVSIDLVGKKVVRKMAAIERPPSPTWDEPDGVDYGAPIVEAVESNRVAGAGGAFSRNPLLGGVIKPVFEVKGKGVELEGRKDKKTRWRRVQDDLDDNEAVILDGGVYGGSGDGQTAGGGDEPA
ncbi:zf-C2HC5-domain-containing protein [Coniochaeta ligniaria NRRL 30616]|uniref:Zf-C2HC5-domain-containing protein n=1 Tax=Coniochaeta ligniaria NRRL 30616 TaxID=1408157 RepID=A0A1J7J023_9PEZI|nr:zf-C2HC5-domain-containing protein [Coniochaeta ligniaria NRRL 30616]